MKNYRLLTGLVGCCGIGLMAGVASSPLEADAAERTRLANEQLEAIVKPGLHTCEAATVERTTVGRIATSRINPDTVIPSANAKEFSAQRVAKTLNGVWRGEVAGDHGEVNVDYFWIIDARRREGLVLAQRSGSVTLPKESPLENPPRISYLMCAHEGYTPALSKPQLHVFTKVSHDIYEATRMVEKATGVRAAAEQPTLEDLWDALVASDYFDTMPHLAFGGGFFKPLEIRTVPGERGAAEVSLRWDAQYRGGGETLLEFTERTPMVGTESAQFVGTSTTSGDFLVASPGNGDPWKVEVVTGGTYDLAFDSTTIGPLVDQ